MGRFLLALVVAGFCAAMCAGPGTLLLPATMRWSERFVCAEGERLEYTFVRTREASVLATECVAPDGARRDVSWPLLLVLAGGYLLLFLVPGLYVVFAPGAKPSGPPPRVTLDAAAEAELEALVATGRKIEAIKRLRERTGLGLAQAKHAVEARSWRSG